MHIKFDILAGIFLPDTRPWPRKSDGKIAKEHLEYFEIYKNDIFKEQNNRYNFTKTYSTGKVLDVTMGKFMAYHGAQILLKNGATEVWNNDFLDNNTSCFIRKFDNDERVIFSKVNNIDDKKFTWCSVDVCGIRNG